MDKNNISINVNISRRTFLKIGATATAAGVTALAADRIHSGVAGPAGERTSASAAGALDEHIAYTTCDFCPSGCGLEVRVVNGRATKVEGNALHPLNQGICCLKGQASLEALYSPERLPGPMLQKGGKGTGEWERISWDEALGMAAQNLDGLRQAGEAHTVVFMHGPLRGQMRPLVNRFMAALGSPNVVYRGSMNEHAARLGTFLTQGVNTLPVYDINNANYVLDFGGTLLETSQHLIANLSATAFMRRGRPNRGKLVAIDPRLSLTGVKADEWVPIRPGTLGAFALGLAYIIIKSNLYDEDFVRDFTFGFEDFEDEKGRLHKGFKSLVLEQYALDRVESITGITTDVMARIAGEFADNRPSIALMPTCDGILSSGNAMYTAMAIHSLNALVGSIDARGGVLTQRYPALADWPELVPDDAAKNSLLQPRLDGAGGPDYPLATSIYQDVADRVLEGKPYPVKAVLMLRANPVFDAPQGGRFAEALMKVPFVVSFAPTLDESASHADLVLPASTFYEYWGDDLIEGTGYAGVSLRQPVVEPVHDTMNPGDAIMGIAKKIGGGVAGAFPWDDYRSMVDFRLEGAGLSLEKLVENGAWSEMVYQHAQPGSTAWGEVVGRDRIASARDGRFDFFSRELLAALEDPGDEMCLPHFEVPIETGNSFDYPFLLFSYELITQPRGWESIIPTLQESYGLQNDLKWKSWLEVSAQAAEMLEVKNGDEVLVETAEGNSVKAMVRIFEGIWANAAYLPMGQGHFTRVKWGRDSRPDITVGVNPYRLLVHRTEPLSGVAATGPTRVRISKVR